MWLFSKKQTPVQKTPQQKRDRLIDGALAREDFAAAALESATAGKFAAVEKGLIAEEEDGDRLLAEMAVVEERKKRLLDLRGDKPSAD